MKDCSLWARMAVWVVWIAVVASVASTNTGAPLITDTVTTASATADDSLPSLPSIAEVMGSAKEMPLETLADLDAFVDDLRKGAQTIIAKAFAERLRRRRRDLNIMSVNVSGAEPHDLGFNTSSMYLTAFHLLTSDRTYFILGTYRNREQRVVELSGPKMRQKNLVLDPTNSLPVTKIAAVLHQGFLWMVFGSAYMNNVIIGCMNQANYQAAIPQSLPVQALGALHYFSAGKNLYLVVGEQQLGSAIYRLEGKKYFDQMEDVRLRTKGVRAITGFHDGKAYYIVFGMTSQEGSQVYQFDVQTETVRLVQEMQDRHVQAALQFLDLHDNKRYLALLNTDAKPRVYWWNRDQLQEWQTLESPPILPSTSLAVVPLSNLENVLCLAHQNNLIFYTDDLTGHYVASFAVRTHCSAMFNLQALKKGQDYLLVYLCENAVTRALTLEGRRLLLSDRHLVQTVTNADELLICLHDLSTEMEGRRQNISLLTDYLDTRHLMSTNGPQTWRGPITFSQGVTVAGTTNFSQSLILPALQEDVSPNSIQLNTRIEALQAAVEGLVNSSNHVLYFSEDQSFPGPVTAPALLVDAAHFAGLRMGKLNGLDLLHLEREVLLMGVDQRVEAPLSLHTLTAHTVTTRPGHATINGLMTSDFMRRNPPHQQIVTGEHSYKSVSVGGNIDARPAPGQEFSINGLRLSTIVRKGSSVTFLARKTVKNLVVVGGANVRLVNGISLRSVADHVIYTDVVQPQTLAGAVTLTSVQVAGDVDVVLINGVDLRQLDGNTVKTTGDFTLRGPVRYMKSLRVTGNLHAPLVNGVEWRYILHRYSPYDTIVSNFTFTSAYVSQAVISDNINGLDLSEEVVLVDATQTISGRVTFKSDVTVTGPEGVLVDEGVTVNNVDISRLLDNVANIGVLVVPEPVTFNQVLTCSGDITATSINGLPLEGIENRYWRKSVSQVVDVPVTLAYAEFLEAVTGASLNGLQMTDFLTYKTAQQITGSYEFTRPVEVRGDLQLGVGSTVNGVDVVLLNRTILSIHGDQTIHGSLVGRHVTVGHLDLSGTLNGVDPRTGYLRLDRTLQHSDLLTFLGTTEATQLTLTGDLTVATLNGRRVEEVARDLVLRDQNATIRGLHTLHLAANATVVNLNVKGSLDGVDLERLFSRSLLKTPPPGTWQMVSGRLHVTGAVHFADSLVLGSANGKNFTKHLENVVLRNYTGLIRGTKTFLEPVTVHGNLDAASINGRDLKEFGNKVFTKSGNQVIRGHYTFALPTTIEHLSTPTINNITMSNVLLVDSPAGLSGTTTFLAQLTIRGRLTSSSTTLAGCDLNRLTNMSMNRASDGSLHLYGPLRVEHFFVNGTMEAPAGVWMDDMNLGTFLDSLVLKSRPQTITGTVEFLSPVHVGLLDKVETINNVRVLDMFSNSVQYNEDETIKCNLDFKNPIHVKRLVVKGKVEDSSRTGLLVGGVRVSRVAAEAVRDEGIPIVITGEKTFASGFTSHNLVINGSLDGVPVEDLVTLGDGRTLQSATFLAPLTVRGNLLVDGLIDGLDLNQVFANRIDLRKPQVVNGSCSFHAIRVLGDLNVDIINDVLLSDLVVRKGKALQVLEGPKTLAGGLVVHGSINTTLLNGVDVLEMNRSVLRIDQPTVITNNVIFTKGVVAKGAVGGSVKAHDAQNLLHELNRFVVTSSSQYKNLLELHRSIEERTAANLATAKQMFVMLHYLGWNASHPLPASSLRHHLSTYLSEDVGTLLVVKECDHACKCPIRTSVYKVWEDGRRAPDLFRSSSGSLFMLPAASLHLMVVLQVTCGGTGGTLTVSGASGEQTFPTELWSLGFVADAGIFVDNNMAYVVTVGRLDDATNVTEAWVVVMRVSHDHRHVEQVWGQTSRRSASKLDLMWVGSTWYLLVANEMEPHKVDKYTTVSTLFVWSSQEEKFIVQKNYVGYHVTSGMFLRVRQPTEEHFFVLAQLRATYSHHANTRVLVYRYEASTGTFEEFQVLQTSDVVCQSGLEVGYSPYLLLLSEEERLDIYRYIPLEGFRLEQSVGVRGSVSMTVVESQGHGQQVWVSTEAPARLQVFQVWHKGVDPSKL